MRHILFVCTGNTCRSPMAQGMFGTMASREGLDLAIRSAGIAAANGAPISDKASRILREKGFQGVLKANALTGEMVDWADLILTMTMNHKQHVLQRFPRAVGKTFTLKEYVEDDPERLKAIREQEQFISEMQVKQALAQPVTEEEKQKWLEYQLSAFDPDIADPFGGSMEQYRECAEEIESYLRKLLRKIKHANKHANPGPGPGRDQEFPESGGDPDETDKKDE